jgi:two-component system, OmpR family, phosphate regulon sensor histidine kinase PhoR
MKDLKRILIFRYTLLVAAVLVAVSLIVVIPIRSFALAQEKEDLEEEAVLLSREFQRFFADETSPSQIDDHLEALAGDLNTRLTLIDTSGKVLGDSSFPAEEMENHLTRPEVAAALEGRVESSKRESRTLGGSYIYSAAPVELDGEIVGVVRVAVAEKDVTPVILQVWWIFLASFGLLLLVIIAASIWTQRTILGDLRKLKDAASDLAAGDLSRRVAETDISDFAELARGFNDMAEQVRQRLDEAMAEKRKMEAVLSDVSTGVMVTDSEGRIVMLNPAAEAILGVEQVKAAGNRVIEVFSSRDMDIAVSRAAAGESVDEQLELLYPKKETLHLKSNPVTGTDGTVIATVSAIEDVTASTRLNRIRQDFVANVSHELRTPVASIRALTESLQAGAWEQPEMAERFLTDLDRETARLSQLIEDLLVLSRLESEEADLRMERVELQGLVRECVEAKARVAKDYGVEVEVRVRDSATAVTGDRRLLRTALGNLLDNAIKYNRPDGRVSVDYGEEKGTVVIRVADEGMGIPREELPRIFERFFRVDKARSRETGGTGLGLSIVKHIAELHGGGINVSSVEGEGSTFSLHLPRT